MEVRLSLSRNSFSQEQKPLCLSCSMWSMYTILFSSERGSNRLVFDCPKREAVHVCRWNGVGPANGHVVLHGRIVDCIISRGRQVCELSRNVNAEERSEIQNDEIDRVSGAQFAGGRRFNERQVHL